jgi:predicted Zn-dependent protease
VAETLEPREADALIQLAHFFLRQGDAERAMVLYAALREAQRQSSSVLRGLAISSLRAGQPKRALSALDALALMGAVDAGFHLTRANVLTALDRQDEAQAAMQAWLASTAKAA